MLPIFGENGYLKNPDDIKKSLKRLSDSLKRRTNIDSPETIQDKILWLMINEPITIKTICSDKYRIREYCVEKIGKDICVPVIAVYDNINEIKWDILPESFVIKCNHGSGMNIIVHDKAKLNIQEVENTLAGWMRLNFALKRYELQYYNIPRKIIIEKYLDDDSQKDSLFDYKFWCFNGEPKFYTINDGHGHGKMCYLDMNNNLIPLERYGFKTDISLITHAPINSSLMKDYARKLSEDFKFVRVDFYEVDGEVYLGEMTFTPGAGGFRYKNEEDNYRIGELLKI